MVCRDKKSGDSVLCGIISHSLECRTASKPGVNVDVSHFGEWIVSVMQGNYTLAQMRYAVDDKTDL